MRFLLQARVLPDLVEDKEHNFDQEIFSQVIAGLENCTQRLEEFSALVFQQDRLGLRVEDFDDFNLEDRVAVEWSSHAQVVKHLALSERALLALSIDCEEIERFFLPLVFREDFLDFSDQQLNIYRLVYYETAEYYNIL